MKLSVRLITYNHAPFIAQAIEGVLMQRTNFDFDIVIGEDESSDGTREIVAEYAKKYPGKIKALFHDRKNVVYYKGRPTSRFNFVQTLKQCRGEYVALLDGDDYWTSPDKLQTQVDFLDANRDYAMCAHDVTRLLPEGKTDVWRNEKSSYDLLELLTLKSYPATCSVVFRNGLFKEFPEWFYKVMVADFPLHLLNAQHGLIGHIPKDMANYRFHPGGIWTSWAVSKEKWSPASIRWNEGLIDFYETFDEAILRRYHRVLSREIAILDYKLAWTHYNLGDLKAVRRHVWHAVKADPFCWSGESLWRLWAASLFPWGYRQYTALRRRRRDVEETTV